MVTTPNNHSPTSAPSPAQPSGETNFIRKTLPSPWAQVVRGGAGDTESQSPTGIHQSLPSSSSSSSSSLATADQPPPPSDDSPKAVVVSSLPPAPVENSSTIASDGGDGGNVGGSKKPAWNKPSNGIVVEIGPVMGAESWPALSESAKIPGKLPPESSSSKIAPVAAAPAVDGSSPSTSQGPIIPNSPQRQGASNAKSSSVTNNNVPNRPKPMRRLGGTNIGSGPAQSSLSNPPTPPPLPHFLAYQLHPGYRNMVPSIPDSSPRDHHRNNNWDARPLVGGSSRRGHFGSHPRGDGSYHHNNYSSRRDHDRGNYANTRDAHSPQPRMPPRGILRHPPPSTAAFLGPQPLGPFPTPVAAYPDFYYFPTVTLDPFRGMPVFPHMPSPAAFFPAAESSLSNVIVNQIDYYFSDINLVNDEFLKSNMDEEGWVPITLIANFPRVKNLTTNIQLILDSMRNSTVVEVQGDKLRRRNDKMNIFMPSAQVQADSGSVSPVESRDNSLTADFQTITLEKTKDEVESSRQSQLPNGSDVAGNTN